ncbi:MAG: hypothetical protein IJ506_05335 [Clostridia bacterium]|nr:hypothetical protein [Clostridia bacterium]
MLKNNYKEVENRLDKAFLSFIGRGQDEDFSYETRNRVYQETKQTNIPVIGLQADGIINDKYYGQNGIPKILILMYESYRIDDGNLNYIWNEAAWLRDMQKPKRMFGVIHKWVEKLFGELGFLISEKKDNLLNYCAWMNISKLGRKTPKMDWRILKRLVESKTGKCEDSKVYPQCAEKLTEQFLAYNPDIVICGNTEWLLYSFLNNARQKGLISERDEINRNLHFFTYKVQNKEIAVFDAYHPSAWSRKTKEKDFVEVINNNRIKIEKILNK